MTAVCPTCGKPVAADFRLCPYCGAELAATPPASAARSARSCLFCDLVGFTSRSESLDPVDVRAFLTPYHERVKGELERFGGTVGDRRAEARVRHRAALELAHAGSDAARARAARALEFWRSVGAVRYIRQLESLLATA